MQEQALGQYRSTLLSALEEVENALTAYVEEQRRQQSLADAAGAARAAATLAMDKYQAGLQDFSTVLDAQRSRLSFDDQLAQSQGAVSADLVRLYKALGGGWQSLAADPERTSRHKKGTTPMSDISSPAKSEVADTLARASSPRRRHRLRRVLTVAILLVCGAAAFFWWQRDTPATAPRYKTAAVQRGDFKVIVTATGNLAPVNQVEVGSELSGIVKSVDVDYNDHVKVGQVLARLDTSKLDAQVLQSTGQPGSCPRQGPADQGHCPGDQPEPGAAAGGSEDEPGQSGVEAGPGEPPRPPSNGPVPTRPAPRPRSARPRRSSRPSRPISARR